MRKSHLWVLVLCTLSPLGLSSQFASAAAASQALNPASKPALDSSQSLKDAYLAALKRSETINIQQELLNQAGEGTRQAYGALAPTVTGSINWGHTEVPVTTSNPNYATDQHTSKIMLDQPLFRGLKDFAGIRQRKFQVEAQSFALKAAAKQLFFDLSTAYFNVLALTADKRNYELEVELNQKRVTELKHFLRIGRSKETDLLTFQANLASIEAQLEATTGSLEQAKDVLAFITGWNRETKLADNEVISSTENLDFYLNRIEERADVKGSLATAKAMGEGVPIARGGHLPSLDLLGDYYYERPGLPTGQNDWDVQLALTIPIFAGGIVQSQVRQAQSIAVQYDLQLSQTRRMAEQEIRTLYDAFIADQKQTVKLELTVAWSKKNYEAELKDYKNGLVTNLDVLQAITTFQDAQRLLDHQKFQVKTDGAKLQAASSIRSEIDIATEVKK